MLARVYNRTCAPVGADLHSLPLSLEDVRAIPRSRSPRILLTAKDFYICLLVYLSYDHVLEFDRKALQVSIRITE